MKEITNGVDRRFMLEDDCILHLIKIQDDCFAVFLEDAYRTEPWESGLRVLTECELKEKYKIQL